MRSFLSIILLFIICSCTQKNKDDITVNVQVKNTTYSKVAILFGPESINEVELDKNGKATFHLEGNNLYPYLAYGPDAKRIFLQKGDNITITFDANNIKDDFQFNGKNAPIIDYLNLITYPPIKHEQYALPIDKFVEFIKQESENCRKLLKARKFETVNPEFVQVEEGRIKCLYAGGLIMYPMAHPIMTQDTTYKPDDNYYQALTDILDENETWLPLPAYREFIRESASIFSTRGRTEQPANFDKKLSQMQYIADHINNDKIKQTLLNEIATEYIQGKSINNITEMENIYNTYVTDPALRALYKKEYDKLNLVTSGHPSPDFQAKDIKGKTYSLKDFKGKYLYIDMWATWCSPCKKEIPYLKELEKKLEGKNIAFVGLSVDSDVPAWEKMVNSGDLSGIQLLLGQKSQFQKDYNINGIPHFIVIDPEGKIVNSNAVRPSSPDAERILSALPGI